MLQLLFYLSLQQFFVTKDHQLKVEQGDTVCVEAVARSLLLVSCEQGKKQWTVSKVRNFRFLIKICRLKLKNCSSFAWS